ncbi:MAG: LicD family protein, partial [Lachnospiraceae bacterium]|nr:LicD family protein [Lachnospiraceae bacterium]
KYTLINPSKIDNYGRVLTKLRKKDTTYRTILETDLSECGVFIDIYMIENTYNFKPFRYVHGLCCLMAGFLLSCRRAYDKQDIYIMLCGNSKKELYLFKFKKIIGKLLSAFSVSQVAKLVDTCYGFCKNSKSRYITIPSDDLGYFFGNIYQREDFFKEEIALFEGRSVYLPGNYKSYLKDKYGDYMLVPQKENRKYPLYLEFKL